jgi:hypothetical protein
VHIDLLITHPLFGRIFGYDGSFRVVRVSESTADVSGAGPAAA